MCSLASSKKRSNLRRSCCYSVELARRAAACVLTKTAFADALFAARRAPRVIVGAEEGAGEADIGEREVFLLERVTAAARLYAASAAP